MRLLGCAMEGYQQSFWDKLNATIVRLEKIIEDNEFYRTGEYRKEVLI